MPKMIVDIDFTIAFSEKIHGLGKWDYENALPSIQVIEKLNKMHDAGWQIVYFTARGMLTYHNDITKINENVLPQLERWLQKHNVKYDEIIIGKPFADHGYYIDDRAIRPVEFLRHTTEELEQICERDKVRP